MMRTGRQFKGVRATDRSTPTSTPRFITYKPQGTVQTTPTTSKNTLMVTRAKGEQKEILRRLGVPAPSELFPESCSV
jgi:hypothetical protein